MISENPGQEIDFNIRFISNLTRVLIENSFKFLAKTLLLFYYFEDSDSDSQQSLNDSRLTSHESNFPIINKSLEMAEQL